MSTISVSLRGVPTSVVCADAVPIRSAATVTAAINTCFIVSSPVLVLYSTQRWSSVVTESINRRV